ncbi:MAG: TIGR03118 family protein [Acidobacteria bacterium]|nr:TIGR03118 family protein [Acidobacteriota bacterium]
MKLRLAGGAALMLLAAGFTYGRSTGPGGRFTGAPGDNQLACTQCHTTNALNSGPGSVKIVFPGGTKYQPGATYRMKVEIRDPNQQRWGFQFTARLVSNPAVANAGDLKTINDDTRIICQDATNKPCSDANQIQFIMHTQPGTKAGTTGGNDWEFDWTAPAAGSGAVTFYVAGNAANGNGNNQGDYIYTSNLSVEEAPSKPALAVPPTAYAVRQMVSDLPGYAERVDPNLKNPWGISMGPTTAFWVSNAGTGTSTLYNTNGELFPAASPLVVKIPSGSGGSGKSKPTGQVWNGTPGFELAAGQPASFIFATEDGTIAAWNRNVDAVNAIIVVDDPGASFKGLAMGVSAIGPTLYAANFKAGTVDVFDYSFKVLQTAGGFKDPNLPAGFAPFNVQRFGGSLYVTYAKQDADKMDDVAGDGNGFINVFDLEGNLQRRLASGGALNSPWGMAIAPAFFGDFSSTLLVANFGDGRINAFDLSTGKQVGVLRYKDGSPIGLEGLWGITFGNSGNGGNANTLYWTAGISGGGAKEEHGMFGSISVGQ